MKRRRLGMVTALSALLLIPIALMWVRSMVRHDQVELAVADMRFCLGSSSQRLVLKAAMSLVDSLALEMSLGRDDVETFGLRQLLPAYQRSLLARTILIPYWIILLPLSILPGKALLHRGGRRRSRKPSAATTRGR